MNENGQNRMPEDEGLYYNPFTNRDDWMTHRQHQQVLIQWEAFTLGMQSEEYCQRLAMDREVGEI